MVERKIGTLEKKAAERLRRLWKLNKRKLGLTQATVAEACGWSNPSAFGAYLHERMALNIEAVLRLAKILEVHPAEIMPEITELLPETREPKDT